ncbi:nucleotidyltransferase family protein [Photobacterium nomapromontoriensis]|uniref:nucleotidyltransferase family protein n=1 Tax=Photobacterium nomapromontoriensis TaxID=2910237 RepID=UPI003D0ED6E8
MITDDEVVAIVLCGGLGSRLGAMTQDQPKPMMDVAGRPFIERVLDNLVEQKVSKIVLAVSYLREVIQRYFGSSYRGIPIEYSVEDMPLGTGGAIVNAVRQLGLEQSTLLVVNGDSYCEFDLNGMLRQLPDADIVMVTKYLHDTGRYGNAHIDKEGYITGFVEKTSNQSGYINAGIYLLDATMLAACSLEKFSFEMAFLEEAVNRQIQIIAQISDSYFIDIGIVDDYMLANEYFKQHDIIEH